MAFISFEGGDGAGKTTQRDILAAWLTELGLGVVATREPGGTELGRAIRELLLRGGEVSPCAEALLYAADRAQHVAEVIRPALAAGKVVLTDRYIDSSLAYQGEGRELGQQDVRGLSDWATDGLYPDLTILLEVPVAEGISRAREEDGAAGLDRIESAGAAFHRAVAERFRTLAEAEPERFLILDGSGSIESVARAVAESVAELLELPLDEARAAASRAAEARTRSAAVASVTRPAPEPEARP